MPNFGFVGLTATLRSKPACERSELAASGHDPAFLIRMPVSSQCFGLVLIGEGDVQGRIGRGNPWS